jgi:hypothetical protein
MNAHSHLRLALVVPTVVPALDPEFRPAWLAMRAFREEAGARAVPVLVAV